MEKLKVPTLLPRHLPETYGHLFTFITRLDGHIDFMNLHYLCWIAIGLLYCTIVAVSLFFFGIAF